MACQPQVTYKSTQKTSSAQICDILLPLTICHPLKHQNRPVSNLTSYQKPWDHLTTFENEQNFKILPFLMTDPKPLIKCLWTKKNITFKSHLWAIPIGLPHQIQAFTIAPLKSPQKASFWPKTSNCLNLLQTFKHSSPNMLQICHLDCPNQQDSLESLALQNHLMTSLVHKMQKPSRAKVSKIP